MAGSRNIYYEIDAKDNNVILISNFTICVYVKSVLNLAIVLTAVSRNVFRYITFEGKLRKRESFNNVIIRLAVNVATLVVTLNEDSARTFSILAGKNNAVCDEAVLKVVVSILIVSFATTLVDTYYLSSLVALEGVERLIICMLSPDLSKNHLAALFTSVVCVNCGLALILYVSEAANAGSAGLNIAILHILLCKCSRINKHAVKSMSKNRNYNSNIVTLKSVNDLTSCLTGSINSGLLFSSYIVLNNLVALSALVANGASSYKSEAPAIPGGS